MHNQPKLVSFVIPVYGSEKIIPELVRKIAQTMNNLNFNFEIIFVCDNSPDLSWDVIKEQINSYDFIKGINLRVNAGQHNAIMAGLARVNGDLVITMDDDLQHSPADVPLLIKKIAEGYDVVYAKFRERSHPTWKILGSHLNNWVSGYLLDKPHELYLSPFRAVKSEILIDILKYQGPYVYLDGLILGATKNIGVVGVNHNKRFAGVSRYGFKKSISLWLKMATSFSIVPLRITSFMGVIFSGVGFILAVLLVIQKFTINMMPIGWSSLIVTILIIGGVQLLALGMIGEYLGRVLLTINSRQQYVISEKIGFNE